MCCNNQLEQLIKDTYNNLVGSSYNFNRCNVQKMANSIQKAAEERFNTTFEVLAGVGDYASKSHFFQNYICKVELEGRYLLAYASPKPETEELPEENEVENSRKEPGLFTMVTAACGFSVWRGAAAAWMFTMSRHTPHSAATATRHTLQPQPHATRCSYTPHSVHNDGHTLQPHATLCNHTPHAAATLCSQWEKLKVPIILIQNIIFRFRPVSNVDV
uniref:Ground-like domain-containing protein n=1 Tax=Ditylenchus dipsaci TaxID=166011 RepID=A0A915EHQ3_9BILA